MTMMMSKKSLPISISLTKRQRFVVTSLVLTLGLLGIQFANVAQRYHAIGVLTLLAFF